MRLHTKYSIPPWVKTQWLSFCSTQLIILLQIRVKEWRQLDGYFIRQILPSIIGHLSDWNYVLLDTFPNELHSIFNIITLSKQWYVELVHLYCNLFYLFLSTFLWIFRFIIFFYQRDQHIFVFIYTTSLPCNINVYGWELVHCSTFWLLNHKGIFPSGLYGV